MQFQLIPCGTSAIGHVLDAIENSSNREPIELRYVPQKMGLVMIGLPLHTIE